MFLSAGKSINFSDAATNEEAALPAPNLSPLSNKQTITDPTPEADSNQPTNQPTIKDPTPVTDANPLSNTTGIVEVQIKYGFALSPLLVFTDPKPGKEIESLKRIYLQIWSLTAYLDW